VMGLARPLGLLLAIPYPSEVRAHLHCSEYAMYGKGYWAVMSLSVSVTHWTVWGTREDLQL
jgi:hypothetical protein